MPASHPTRILLLSESELTMGFYLTGNGKTYTPERSYPAVSVASVEPDPFGSLIVSTESTYISSTGGNAFRFSTKYFIAEIGVYDYGYRPYSSALGRWLSRDPLGDEAFWPAPEEEGLVSLLDDHDDTTYAFVVNEPVSRADFLGLVDVGNVTCTKDCTMEAEVLGNWSKAIAECIKAHEEKHISQCKGDNNCTFCKLETEIDPGTGQPKKDPKTGEVCQKCSTEAGFKMPEKWGSLTFADLQCPALDVERGCLRAALATSKPGPDRQAIRNRLADVESQYLRHNCANRTATP